METTKEQVLKIRLTRSFGKVYTITELQEKFKVISFSSPYVTVERLEDKARGTMQFTHMPRFYYGFIKNQKNEKNNISKKNEKA